MTTSRFVGSSLMGICLALLIGSCAGEPDVDTIVIKRPRPTNPDGGNAGSGGGTQNDSGITVDTGIPDQGLTEDSSCAADAYQAEPVPLALYLMLDRSGSMGTSSKWDDVQVGLTDFFSDPASAGLTIALSYFPAETDDCSAVAYATPVVEPARLTQASAPTDVQEQKLNQSLSTTSPGGGTPMLPAFTGTLGFALSYAKNHPDEKVIAVLVTDGSPSACEQPDGTRLSVSAIINRITELASASRWDDPPILTFTIGLEGSKESELQQIAQAGGGQAFFLGGSQNVQQDLLAKLQQISAGQIACEYLIPEGEGEPDFEKVNVRYFPGVGTGQDLFKVSDAASCVLNGWYYDDDLAPTRINLCPSTCEALRADPGATVKILLGCQTIVPR